jgi:hypothetical protein
MSPIGGSDEIAKVDLFLASETLVSSLASSCSSMVAPRKSERTSQRGGYGGRRLGWGRKEWGIGIALLSSAGLFYD